MGITMGITGIHSEHALVMFVSNRLGFAGLITLGAESLTSVSTNVSVVACEFSVIYHIIYR